MNKISIIVPIYNVENQLPYCLNSIINQTYKNLEIILVNDGSKDNSLNIINEFAKRDDRIVLIDKENGGLSSARNAGLSIATGDFIGFVDSDDIIIDTFYEYLHSIVTKYNADIAQGKFLRIDNNKLHIANSILNEKNSQIETTENILTNIEALNTLYGIIEEPYVQEVVVWNKLYKKSLFTNIKFIENRLHEDEFTTHKILYNCKKIVCSNKYIYGYMQTSDSIMRKEISLKRVQDCLDASLNAIDFFSNNNLPNIEYKISIRYLSNCIELSGKILNENSNNNKTKLSFLEDTFIKMYEQKINLISSSISNSSEKSILDLLKIAYLQSKNHNLGSLWPELKNIIKS